MRTAKITALAAAVMMMTVSTGNEAIAQQIGVVGLFKIDPGAATNVDQQKISDLGCQTRRAGAIVGEQGDIDVKRPNHFIFLACEHSLLSAAAKREVLSGLIPEGEVLAFLEGALTDNPDNDSSSAATDREYILKISHYNNRDTDRREQDLERIMQAVEPDPDRFIDESFIAVNRSMGMPTPDEVVILFYESPERADRFRKNNRDILRDVGAFNKAHLNDFIYYSGKIVR
ncbi:MAG: hypothetical protein O7B24_15775 [Alphaproteobacteria bacterium]|nr:hypothetical protein [Alphaproteobacteria bacterium]